MSQDVVKPEEVLEGAVVEHEGVAFRPSTLSNHIWATDGSRFSPSYHFIQDENGIIHAGEPLNVSWGATI